MKADIWTSTDEWFWEYSLTARIVGCSFIFQMIFLTAILRTMTVTIVMAMTIVWIGVGSIHSRTMHYSDVIMPAMASRITSLTIVYATVYSGADKRKHQSSASLAFVTGIHRWPVTSPHKGPVTRKMFPFDDVIMNRKQCPGKHIM